MTDHGVRYFGGLIEGGVKDEITKHYKVRINPAFARFFKAGLWVMVMAQSNAERQRKHRRKVKGSVVRIDLEIPIDVAAKLGYLAYHWGCTRRQALSRLLLETWWREGRPIPGYDDEGNPLPGN